MVPVQVRLTEQIMEEIDRILKKGIHINRSDFIRDAIRKHIEFHSDGQVLVEEAVETPLE